MPPVNKKREVKHKDIYTLNKAIRVKGSRMKKKADIRSMGDPMISYSYEKNRRRKPHKSLKFVNQNLIKHAMHLSDIFKAKHKLKRMKGKSCLVKKLELSNNQILSL